MTVKYIYFVVKNTEIMSLLNYVVMKKLPACYLHGQKTTPIDKLNWF